MTCEVCGLELVETHAGVYECPVEVWRRQCAAADEDDDDQA